jgi:hypothetical protein
LTTGAQRAPGWDEVAPLRATGEERDISLLDIHVKRVPRIILAKLRALAQTASPEMRARLEHALRWLTDVSMYDAVPRLSADGAPAARMDQAAIETLRDFGIIEEIPRCEVRGWTKMFFVPEWAKNRRRPIKHTFIVNEHLDKDTLSKVCLATKKDICEFVKRGTHFIAFDFSAYFDQFEYSPEVGKLFCFRKNGKFYRLRTLAMGQRQAVEVASTVTELLLDFPKKSHSASVIDNVIFVGSAEDVAHDAKVFLQRVAEVGAKLNEDTSDVESMIKQRGEWCGVAIDLEAKTVQLTAKTLEKLRYSWARVDEWSWRGFAAHVGLLFWSWGILELPMAEFFPLLRLVSTAGRMLTAEPQRWDTKAVIGDTALKVMKRWTDMALDNRPRVVREDSQPEWLVCTDASSWGWGYVALNNRTSEVRKHGAPWSWYVQATYGPKLLRSTFTEPMALYNAAHHLLPANQPTHVRFGTDNTVTQASYARGFNTHSYDINDCLLRLRKRFGPAFTFSFVHVAGTSNMADSLSRGAASVTASDGEIADNLRLNVGLSSGARGGQTPEFTLVPPG